MAPFFASGGRCCCRGLYPDGWMVVKTVVPLPFLLNISDP